VKRVAIIAALASSLHAEPRYSMADLRALIARKMFHEAVRHLRDVPPAERRADWDAVAVDASVGWLGELAVLEPTARLVAIRELERELPNLLAAPRYRSAREGAGWKGFVDCFAARPVPELCVAYAPEFVVATDPAFALRLAKLVRSGTVPYVSLPLFERAAVDRRVCADDDLRGSVMAGLGLPRADELARHARALAASCWDALKRPILDELAAQAPGYFSDNACEVVRARNASARACR
jgi:hypothetical protein